MQRKCSLQQHIYQYWNNINGKGLPGNKNDLTWDGGNVVLKNIKHGIGLNGYKKQQEIRIEKKCVHLHSLSNIL